MKLTTEALIIRVNNNIGEADRFVTALTRDCGVIHASVRGARHLRNRNGSATQLLCHCRLSLFRGREKYIIDDAEPLQVFFEVREDLQKLSLAQYFCELAGALAPREEAAPDTFRLLLGALRYLAAGTRPLPLIKAAVELRLLSQVGYAPALTACTGCGEAAPSWFSVTQGILLCDTCKGTIPAVPLSAGVLAALRHCCYGPLEKCFSFSLSGDSLAALADLAERFLLAQTDRGFNTLDFYHGVQSDDT